MIIRNQGSQQKTPPPRISATHQWDSLHVAVIVEDLRLPLDEGAKNVSFSLIRSLIKKGAQVSIFTRYGNPLLENVFPLPENKFLFGFSFVRNQKARGADAIIYIPTSSGTFGAIIRAATIKIQSFYLPLALLSLQYRELPVLARFCGLCRCVDIVFTQAQASKDVFCSLGFKTYLLPGGVDHTIFRPADGQDKHLLRKKYGFHDEDQIILHVGHCNRDRNVMVLTKLIRSGVKVILIASTSTAIDHDLLFELRQSGITVITEYIENIHHYYQMADCYLFPVLRPTSAIDTPLSVLEAMACNLPVVMTRFGALPDRFEAGNGLYFAETEDEIIGMVNRALDGKNCKTSEMVSQFSWDQLTEIMMEKLQKTIKR